MERTVDRAFLAVVITLWVQQALKRKRPVLYIRSGEKASTKTTLPKGRPWMKWHVFDGLLSFMIRGVAMLSSWCCFRGHVGYSEKPVSVSHVGHLKMIENGHSAFKCHFQSLTVSYQDPEASRCFKSTSLIDLFPWIWFCAQVKFRYPKFREV